MKQKLLLVAALFFGVLAFILTYYQIMIEKEKALGAARELDLVRFRVSKPQGDKIEINDIEKVTEKRFITSSKSAEVEWKDREDIIGKELDTTVVKGDIMKWYYTKSDKKGKGEGLAAIIRQGYRALSISVDTTSSVTNLVKPNHHVDIIGTFRFPEMKGDKNLDTITLTILQNVEILATGTQMANSSSAGDAKQVKNYGTVTLLLSPKEVEMILFATQKGRLTLSLRNYEDTQIAKDLQSVNFKYLEENISKYNAEREKNMFGTGSSKSSGSKNR